MKGKKIITISIIIILILIGIIYNLISKVNVYNKKQIIKEMSQIEYENEITSLNTSHEDYANYIQTSKINLAQAITNAGVTTNTDSTFETMISNIENIFNERTKLDETVAATADNILEGKQAYVNGQLIIGTGKDAEEQYSQGVVDGMKQALDNLEVEYTYHQHSGDPSVKGGCYGDVPVPCNGSIHAISDGVYYTSDKSWHTQARCNQCGYTYDWYGNYDKYEYIGVCNRTTTGIGIACGKTTETIESVTIKY